MHLIINTELNMSDFIERIIDQHLLAWKNARVHKPLLLRGARQVGKSSAVRHLDKQFKYFAEVNFEEQKTYQPFSKVILM